MFRYVFPLLVLPGALALLAAGCTEIGPDDEEAGDDATAAASSPLTATGIQELTGTSGFGWVVAKGNFNQDAYDDLVVGLPEFSEIQVFTGTSTGFGTTPTVFKQGSNGVPETFEWDDSFGHSLAVGDFNDDGIDDIAVGAPDETYHLGLTFTTAGAVFVIYGPLGSPALSHDMFRRVDTGVPLDPHNGEEFGWALAAGDFNGDGKDDLAVGTPYRDTGTDNEAGTVTILYGSSTTGINPAGGSGVPAAVEIDQTSSGVYGSPEPDDMFGFALAAGNFNGDVNGSNNIDDLVIGVPEEDISGVGSDVGMVHVLYGTTSGLTGTGSGYWWGDASENINYTEGAGNQFGRALAAGNTNLDAYDDLVIGVPFVAVSSQYSAGGVVVLRGSSTGIVNLSNYFLTQASPNIQGSPDFDDMCGYSVAVGNVNGDGSGDVLWGCPGESVDGGTDSGNGAFNVAYGPFFTTSTGDVWHRNSSGVPDDPDVGAQLGHSLCVGKFNNDSYNDVAVGEPGFGGGSVLIFRGN